MQVDLKGQRYTITTTKGLVEVGPCDVLHIKGMSLDGLRGLSPVRQCRVALGLSSSLQQSAEVFTEQGSKSSGILTAPNGQGDQLEREVDNCPSCRRANLHPVAVAAGDVKFEPIGFSQDDSSSFSSASSAPDRLRGLSDCQLVHRRSDGRFTHLRRYG